MSVSGQRIRSSSLSSPIPIANRSNNDNGAESMLLPHRPSSSRFKYSSSPAPEMNNNILSTSPQTATGIRIAHQMVIQQQQQQQYTRLGSSLDNRYQTAPKRPFSAEVRGINDSGSLHNSRSNLHLDLRKAAASNSNSDSSTVISLPSIHSERSRSRSASTGRSSQIGSQELSTRSDKSSTPSPPASPTTFGVRARPSSPRYAISARSGSSTSFCVNSRSITQEGVASPRSCSPRTMSALTSSSFEDVLFDYYFEEEEDDDDKDSEEDSDNDETENDVVEDANGMPYDAGIGYQELEAKRHAIEEQEREEERRLRNVETERHQAEEREKRDEEMLRAQYLAGVPLLSSNECDQETAEKQQEEDISARQVAQKTLETLRLEAGAVVVTQSRIEIKKKKKKTNPTNTKLRGTANSNPHKEQAQQ